MQRQWRKAFSENHGRRNGLLIISLLLAVFLPLAAAGASGEGDVAVSVSFRGLKLNALLQWQVVPLSGRFELLAGEGRTKLGEITAHLTQEQQAGGQETLAVTRKDAQSGLFLRPVPETMPETYTLEASIPVPYDGEDSLQADVLAFAKEGLFTLRDTRVENGQAVAAGSASFEVLDEAGNVALSFSTNDQGEYSALRTLPAGSYILRQTLAPENTLPIIEDVSFEIVPYLGTEESIAGLAVQNRPLPLENGRLGPEMAFEAASARDQYAADQTASFAITGLSPAGNTLPLKDFTVELTGLTLLDGEGETHPDQSGKELASLTVTPGTQGIQAQIWLYDEAGKQIGDARRAAAGQALSLEGLGAVSARIVYGDGNGEAVVPAGFDAGEIQVEIGLEKRTPDAKMPSVAQIVLNGKKSWQYEYPGRDRAQVTARAESEPLLIRTGVLDSRAKVSLSAQAQNGKTVLQLRHEGGASLDRPQLAVKLPDGWRIQDQGSLPEEVLAVLRGEDSDTLIWALQDALSEGQEQSLSLPAAFGAGDGEGEAWILSGAGLAPTLDNPLGLRAAGEKAEGCLLADAVLGLSEPETYAYLRWTARGTAGSVSQEGEQRSAAALSGKIFEDIDGSGRQEQGEQGAAGKLVLWRASASKWGGWTVTDEQGAFDFSAIPAIPGQGEVLVQLPENTAIAAELAPGGLYRAAEGSLAEKKEVTVGFSRMCALYGQVALKGSQAGLAQVEVTLLSGGQPTASAVTDGQGQYRFGGLLPGTYQVTFRLPRELAKSNGFYAGDGYEQASASEAALPETVLGYGAQVKANAAVRQYGSILGTIKGRQGGAGSVSLFMNGELAAQAALEDSGSFRFDGLLDGSYTGAMDLPDGWAVRLEGSSSWQKGSASFEADVLPGKQAEIRMEQVAMGSLRLRFSGANLSDAAVTLEGPESRGGKLDEDGECFFEELIPGAYTVKVLLPGTVISDKTGTWQISQTDKGAAATLSVEIAQGTEASPQEALLVQSASLAGVVFQDSDRDDAQGSSEGGLAGAKVTLETQQNGNWAQVRSVTTGPEGSYDFKGLLPGVYRLALELPAGKMLARQEVLQSFQLENGQELSRPVGVIAPAQITAVAFWDSNMDGIRGVYERPIEGTLVEVLTGDTKTIVAQGLTDFEGQAVFESVPPGEYRVRLTLPEGYWISAQGEGVGLQNSSVPVSDGRQGITSVITIAQGQAAGVSIGGVKTGKISGKIWLDEDDDGIMAKEEPGLAGCRVTLTGNKHGNTYAYSTDDSGEYAFEVRQDTYVMNVYGPEGMIFARFNLSGGENRSIFTEEGLREDKRQFELTSNVSQEVANIGFVPEAVLEGLAYMDANYNGVRDEGEKPLAGVAVKLSKTANGREVGRAVTGEDGAFRFADLRGGEYRIQAVLPEAGLVFTRVPGGDAPYGNVFEKRRNARDNTAVITLAGGKKHTLGVGALTPGVLSGSVFMDDNFNGALDHGEKPVPGVAVSLVSPDGAAVATVTTNNAGLYEFTQVMPMDYTLAVSAPADSMFTIHGQGEGRSFIESASGGQGISEIIPLAMGETVSNVNAGMILPASVAGTVFADANDDGLQSEGEGGFEGVTVSLLDAGGAVLKTARTDKDGAFAFEQLTPGNYSLSYLLPEDTAFAPAAAQGNQIAGEGTAADGEGFSLHMGEGRQAPLCGAVALGRLAGLAFHDKNGNGAIDEGEEPLAGVRLTLTGGREGGQAQAVTTGDEGAFSWTGLRPGTYVIDVSLPSGMIFSQEGDASLMNAALTGEGRQSVSLGMGEALEGRLVGGVTPAALSGSLWLDENNNGRREAEEAPMAGLRVRLADSRGRIAATLTTDENGAYAAPVLQPGDYDLTVFLPDDCIGADTAAGESLFEQKEPGIMALGGLALEEGGEASGLMGGVRRYTAFGGTAWADEAGTIAPIANVQVSLYDASDPETPLETMLTAEDGAYRFQERMPGEYLLKAALPEGYLFVKPDDARLKDGAQVSIVTDTDAGSGNAFTLRMGADQTALDIGAVKSGKLGDLCWLDENENGLQDTGEPGIPGLTVVLLQEGKQVAAALTDAYGYYLFTDVYPMASRVQVNGIYPELAVTQHRTDFPILASALTGGQGETAVTDDVDVKSGGSNFDCDLGFVLRDKNKRPDAIQPPPKQNWE